MDSTRAGSQANASLLSLPNELLLQLLDEPSPLLSHRQKANLDGKWFTNVLESCAKYTAPWSAHHHPIAMVLSQTCRRLRELMLPCIWQEIGMNTLEDLVRARDGLRLFPERALLVQRLEWSWCSNHPVLKDYEWFDDHYDAFYQFDIHDHPLEKLLEPPYRRPSQPLTTPEQCVAAITEVVCQLDSLNTLLWVSFYLHMELKVVNFLANKSVPLKAFQVSLDGLAGMRIKPGLSPYWKFAQGLEKLSLSFCPQTNRDIWRVSDMKRWEAYEEDFAGMEEYCKEVIAQEDADWELDYGNEPQPDQDETVEERVAFHLWSEKQQAIVFKTLIVAAASLKSLIVEPSWVLATPALAAHWVQIEEFDVLIQRHLGGRDYTQLEQSAHLGRDALFELDEYWYAERAQWHLAAAAIRPAIYHLARHRKQTCPLTGEEVQTLADRPPVYPASLFYPCFRRPVIAQRMADAWEELVERGQSERIQCMCVECRAA